MATDVINETVLSPPCVTTQEMHGCYLLLITFSHAQFSASE